VFLLELAILLPVTGKPSGRRRNDHSIYKQVEHDKAGSQKRDGPKALSCEASDQRPDPLRLPDVLDT